MHVFRWIAALAAAAAVLPAAAGAATLKAPALQAPAAGAQVEAMPAFTWAPVKRAAGYEVQVAADEAFGSLLTRRSITTGNTATVLLDTAADGTYSWRVRAIGSGGRAGRWSGARQVVKAWTTRPNLLGPVGGLPLPYPAQPLVLSWSSVPGTFKYLVHVATDPSMAQSALEDRGRGIETSGTSLAVSQTLAPGQYYWTVTPTDAQGHKGRRSAVGTFVWTWDARTAGTVVDRNAAPEVFDPQLTWSPVPGASAYEVEVNTSDEWAVGSKVCCGTLGAGTSVSPQALLPNNRYYWRVRAFDVNGNPGGWNVQPPFTKTFDAVEGKPSITDLRVRDHANDTLPVKPTLAHPVVAWSPVPGASGYEVQATRFAAGCDWTKRVVEVQTPVSAWTPIDMTNADHPGSADWPAVTRSTYPFVSGAEYCVRVLAIAGHKGATEVISDWTQVNGPNQPAFAYQDPPNTAESVHAVPAYTSPARGEVLPRTPLLTWEALDGAGGYWVAIARDPALTNVVHLAYVRGAAYAPRVALNDEVSAYYWAVFPAGARGGSDVLLDVSEANGAAAGSFLKRTLAPQQLEPAAGAEVEPVPAFTWTAAEGAKEYRLQVATDPGFGDPLVDELTAATSYTPAKALPVDTQLFWRVRAIDGSRNGLSWSPSPDAPQRSFRRRLPVPQPAAANPQGGDAIPVLSWSQVPGAIAYDMHVDQADGTRKDFRMSTSAFTPTAFYGTGVWRWQVRAVFPGPASGVTGAYSALVPFARFISAPTGTQVQRTRTRVLFRWDPMVMARRYRVEVADSSSFTRIIDRITTDHTTWAPDLTKTAYKAGGTLHWRVAVVDEGQNVGAFSTHIVTLTRGLALTVPRTLRRGRGRLAVTVRDLGRRPVRGARVKVTGAGLRLARRTSRSGRLVLMVRPRRRGTVTVTATRKGYRSATKRLRVR